MFSRISNGLLSTLTTRSGALAKAKFLSNKTTKLLMNRNNFSFSTVAAYAVYKQNTSKLSFQEKEQTGLKNLRKLSLQETVALVWDAAEAGKGSNLLWTNLEEKLLPEINKMSEIDLSLTIWSK
jgi:hypothetical protein